MNQMYKKIPPPAVEASTTGLTVDYPNRADREKFGSCFISRFSFKSKCKPTIINFTILFILSSGKLNTLYQAFGDYACPTQFPVILKTDEKG